MHPVVRLEAMQDLNEYLEEQMAKGDERRQKQFHVRVEEEDSYQDGILNDGAFSTDGLVSRPHFGPKYETKHSTIT